MAEALKVFGVSGSQMGLLVGGQPVSTANPLPTNAVLSATIGSVTTLSGSLVGILYGGVPAGQVNPFWITGSVFVINPSAGGSGFQNVTGAQGSPGPIGSPWPVLLVSGSDPVGTATHPFIISGAIGFTEGPTLKSGSVTGLLVGGQPVSLANPVPTNAVISGNINIGSSVTASVPITDTVVTRRFGVVSLSSSMTVTNPGITTLYQPATGKQLLLKWLGIFTPDTNSQTLIVQVYISGGNGYIFPLPAPAVFQHAFVRSGSVNAPLYLSSSASGTIYANFDVEDI